MDKHTPSTLSHWMQLQTLDQPLQDSEKQQVDWERRPEFRVPLNWWWWVPHLYFCVPQPGCKTAWNPEVGTRMHPESSRDTLGLGSKSGKMAPERKSPVFLLAVLAPSPASRHPSRVAAVRSGANAFCHSLFLMVLFEGQALIVTKILYPLYFFKYLPFLMFFISSCSSEFPSGIIFFSLKNIFENFL